MDEDVIPVLRVDDIEVALRWYALLGFGVQWRRAEPPHPGFVEIARGDVRLFLSEHSPEHAPDSSIYLRVRDVAAVAAEFGMAPELTPWAEEIELHDPDGNQVRVGTPLR